MKKYIFLSVAAAAMMASCSNDEVDSPAMSPNNAIGFTAFTNNTSRGTGTENTVVLTDDPTGGMQKIAQVLVYGYRTPTSGAQNAGEATLVFDGVWLTGPDWTYSPQQYWQPNSKYDFMAMATSVDEQGNGFVGVSPKQITPTDDAPFGIIAFDNHTAKGKNDVVVATATQTTDANTPLTGTTSGAANNCPEKVSLVLNHIESRVQFAFTTEESATGKGDAIAAPYAINIGNLSFNVGKTQKGEFAPKNTATTNDYGTWTVTPTDGTSGEAYTQAYSSWTYTTAPNGDTYGNEGASECHYFIPFAPTTAAPATVTFTASLIQEVTENGSKVSKTQQTRTFTANLPENTKFEQGKSYKITFNLSRSNFDMTCPIEFNVTVTDWATYTNVDAGEAINPTVNQ